ncbi:phosphoserine/homoserine phosphotransferase [Desulfosalsimonas propionicica]|uniref:phosphoserine phosphatase n=1 Tax=Desulfosalsimonas propionicica TaxID=332175 RepID=A0A7W0CC90_9BACT|nr:bifunctional phosphoserine phosphatase/homoserine phosphotransferase ThrH [Desulfosalsimonas propionicica]MBA2883073.1 phosphoserine/homoserine phosphotransferase [Desulfosalsimonas propionicica]
MQHMLCSDLEGVFVPEIWINVAEKTGIEELRLTTRDISDYNVLMDKRLSILDAHGLTLNDIQAVIAEIEPLPGALEFLDAIRAEHQIIIVSDTFLEFAGPLMEKLKRPTLFCNCLKVADTGRITGYELRQENGKKKTTRALQDLNYRVIAFGDSYNDISMLQTADNAFLFRPPENVVQEFPQIAVAYEYDQLAALIQEAISSCHS